MAYQKSFKLELYNRYTEERERTSRRNQNRSEQAISGYKLAMGLIPELLFRDLPELQEGAIRDFLYNIEESVF
jgi:hypothetical protein